MQPYLQTLVPGNKYSSVCLMCVISNGYLKGLALIKIPLILYFRQQGDSKCLCWMFLTSPAVLSVRMSQKLESYGQHSLNLEGWAVRVADLAAWCRLWTGALLRWQQPFWSAATSQREENLLVPCFTLHWQWKQYFPGELSWLWADSRSSVCGNFSGWWYGERFVHFFWRNSKSGIWWKVLNLQHVHDTGDDWSAVSWAWEKAGSWPHQKSLQ